MLIKHLFCLRQQAATAALQVIPARPEAPGRAVATAARPQPAASIPTPPAWPPPPPNPRAGTVVSVSAQATSEELVVRRVVRLLRQTAPLSRLRLSNKPEA